MLVLLFGGSSWYNPGLKKSPQKNTNQSQSCIHQGPEGWNNSSTKVVGLGFDQRVSPQISCPGLIREFQDFQTTSGAKPIN